VVTDHCSLCNLLSLKNPNGRLARWALHLQPYSFTVAHTSGKSHGHADALSRYPVLKAPSNELVFDDTFLLNISVPPPTATETFPNLLTAQRSDPILGPKIQEKLRILDGQSPTMKNMEDFSLHDGLIYKANCDPTGPLWLLCIPSGLRTEILKSVHNDPSGGHLGIFKTWSLLKNRFWWPNMYPQTRKYIESCLTCQFFQRRNTLPPGPLCPLAPPNIPFDRIAIDFIGPFPRSASGKCYILTISDHLTRYIEACPVPRATSAHAISALLKHIIYRHGFPKIIIADQGPHFDSHEFKSFCTSANIELKFTPPYSPNVNGICEKNNDTIKRTLAKLLHDNDCDWESHLQPTIFAHNSSTHSVTKFSPFFLAHGRHPRFNCDSSFPTLIAPLEASCPNTRARNVLEANAIAKNNTENFQSKQKSLFDSTHPQIEFLPDQLVLHARLEPSPGHVQKFLPRWKGPYRVISKIGPITYKLQDLRPSRRKRNHVFDANARHLKPFYPSYLSQAPSETTPKVPVESSSNVCCFQDTMNIMNLIDLTLSPDHEVDMEIDPHEIENLLRSPPPENPVLLSNLLTFQETCPTMPIPFSFEPVEFPPLETTKHPLSPLKNFKIPKKNQRSTPRIFIPAPSYSIIDIPEPEIQEIPSPLVFKLPLHPAPRTNKKNLAENLQAQRDLSAPIHIVTRDPEAVIISRNNLDPISPPRIVSHPIRLMDIVFTDEEVLNFKSHVLSKSCPQSSPVKFPCKTPYQLCSSDIHNSIPSSPTKSRSFKEPPLKIHRSDKKPTHPSFRSLPCPFIAPSFHRGGMKYSR